MSRQRAVAEANSRNRGVHASLPFPWQLIMNGLKAELPIYMAAAEDVSISTQEKKVERWYDHKEQLPHWATVQPISATIICSKESVLASQIIV